MVGELVLDRFLVEQRLGSGGFGTVYRAWDSRLERDVAVKVIETGGDSGGRVVREAQAAARLNHPGIVTLYELGEEGGRAFLVSELVDGCTLRELSLEGSLGDREVGEIGAELCEALEHAHARGVIHRDIKPQNVLVGERDSHARLMDFGIARLSDAATLTATGSVVGTLAYMAPEQAEGLSAGPEADVFALGLTLYECWSGENPHRRATPAATARAIGGRLPSLHRLRPDLPAPLTDAIDLALDPDPTRRPSPRELHDAIAGSLDVLDDRRAAPRARQGPAVAARVWQLGAADALSAAIIGGLLSAAMVDVGGPGLAWVLLLVPLAAGLTLLRPRLGYLAAALGLTAWLGFAAGRPGAAVVLAALTIPPSFALRNAGRVLLVPAAAPALGAAGLAIGFPVLAALAQGWRERALVATTGLAWLVVAEVVLHRDFYLGAGADPPRDWQASAASALSEVMLPLATDPRLLAAAALWAMAAVAVGALLAPLRSWRAGRPPHPRRIAERRIAAPATAVGGGGRGATLP